MDAESHLTDTLDSDAALVSLLQTPFRNIISLLPSQDILIVDHHASIETLLQLLFLRSLRSAVVQHNRRHRSSSSSQPSPDLLRHRSRSDVHYPSHAPRETGTSSSGFLSFPLSGIFHDWVAALKPPWNYQGTKDRHSVSGSVEAGRRKESDCLRGQAHPQVSLLGDARADTIQRTTHSEDPNFSFVDVRDVSYHVMRMYRLWKGKDVQEVLDGVRKDTVGNIANAANRAPFIRRDVDSTLLDITKGFKESMRVPIFESGKIVRVMSPADLLTLLTRWKVCHYLEHTKVNVRELAKKDVITLFESDSLIKALTIMERNGYSALPIISERNFDKVLEVITVKDTKYIGLALDNMAERDIFNAPALAFVRFVRNETFMRAEFTRIQSFVKGYKNVEFGSLHAEWTVLSDTASLEEIFNVFFSSLIHRIVFKDPKGRMTGMLTLTDLMQKLADILIECCERHHNTVSS